MISLLLAIFHFTLSAQAATPPPVSSTVDTSGLLDLTPSAEELMVSEGMPATPESGTENPQDLLQSGPVIQTSPPRKSAKSDGLPSSLPLVSGKNKSAPADELPPASSADSLAPEASTEIPTETTSEEGPVADAPPEPTTAPENLEEVVVPAEPETVADSESGTTTRRWDRTVPLYERENPTWGVDIHMSLQALGTPIQSEQLDSLGNGTGVVEETNVKNFGFGFEYEPKFLQSIGVVSIGPSFNSYVLEPQGDLTSNAFSIYSLGFSAKYQLKFMRGQPIVPFVGFEGQMIRYSFQRADIGSGWTTSTGLSFGALVLLNWMEPSAAHNLWAETGIKRSYLVAEFKNLQAGEDLLSSDGAALYFGLRLEY